MLCKRRGARSRGWVTRWVTVTSVKRVTTQQHPNKKSKADPVTIIGQNSSEHQTNPWGRGHADVGLGVEQGLRHGVGCRTGAAGLGQGLRQNVAPTVGGTLRWLPPPALPQPGSPPPRQSGSGLGQEHSPQHLPLGPCVVPTV